MPAIHSHLQARMLGGPGSINEGGVKLFSVQLIFLVLGWLFVGLRAYVRIFKMKKLYIDDYLMFFAVLMYTPYAVIVLHSIIYGGTGAHTDQFTLEGAMISLRAWYVCEVMYSPISAAIRTSIGVLLLRLANQKLHKQIIWTNLIVIWISCLAYFFILLFQCLPLDHFWMQFTGQEGYCVNPWVTATGSIAFSVIAAISDWVLGLLPIAILWNVKLNRRTKATISILLGMGLCAGVALLVRIPLIKALAASTDFLYQTIDTAIWTVLEPSLGIIAGCASTLRPLFENWGFDRLSSHGSAGSRNRQTKGAGPRGMSMLLANSRRPSQIIPEYNTAAMPKRPAEVERRLTSSQDSTAAFELKTTSQASARLSARQSGVERWADPQGDKASVNSNGSEPTLNAQESA